ncbi:MAG: glycosyltransferase family 2 protein [Myxococcota bacterium]|nr:glycosyltransferase family 2 protein [Myxococcota bacterium]
MTLLCRNEIDIVREMVEFHLSMGVDTIIATDNASDDGTREVLQDYQRRGSVILLCEPELTHMQSSWVTRMARIAYQDLGADWVIHSDADEFWWPSSGTLKDEFERIGADTCVVRVARSNFTPVHRPDNAPCSPFFATMTFRDRVSLNAQGKPLPGKVCHRGMPDIEVADGNHHVSVKGKRCEAESTDGIHILHFPIRTCEQYERKISEGAQALLRNKDRLPSTGRTWLEIYERHWLTGSFRQHFMGLCLTTEQCAAKVRAGDLIEDERLKTLLGRLLGRT